MSNSPQTSSRVPSRRSLLTASAWAAPVIAAAAATPFASASPCDSRAWRVDWNRTSGANLTTVTRTINAARTSAEADVTVAAGGTARDALVLTITSVVAGSQRLPDAHLEVRTDSANYGGLGSTSASHAYPLNVSAASTSSSTISSGRGNRQETTFRFDRPVTNLAFTITDIDGSARDAVEITPPPGTASPGTQVTGAGVNGNPWQRSSESTTNISSTSSAGNLSLVYPGPITEFTITYYHLRTSDTDNQNIYISDFTLNAGGCAA